MPQAIRLYAPMIGWALPALADGNTVKGREVSIKFCARCHVIGDYDRYGGIENLVAFVLTLKNWLRR